MHLSKFKVKSVLDLSSPGRPLVNPRWMSKKCLTASGKVSIDSITSSQAPRWPFWKGNACFNQSSPGSESKTCRKSSGSLSAKFTSGSGSSKRDKKNPRRDSGKESLIEIRESLRLLKQKKFPLDSGKTRLHDNSFLTGP